jgi:uncharacterized protein YbjT (DUF2867 family)
MILITGGTGTTGRDIVRQLKGASGVRAMVRDPERAGFDGVAGLEVVRGDFDRPETLEAALEGVERALLLSPPDPRTVEHQASFIEAAKRAGTRHVVKFSAIGADASAPGGFMKWHGEVEEILKASGLAYTMLQPNSFMQNLLGSAQAIAAEGKIYQSVGDARASLVDTRDVAAVAARVLTEEGHEGKSYVITGPEALSYHEVAAKLSEATGRRITYVPVSPAEFSAGASAQGLPDWLVHALGLLNENFARGDSELVTDAVREVAEVEPRTFDQFARDFAPAFGGEQGGGAK